MVRFVQTHPEAYLSGVHDTIVAIQSAIYEENMDKLDTIVKKIPNALDLGLTCPRILNRMQSFRTSHCETKKEPFFHTRFRKKTDTGWYYPVEFDGGSTPVRFFGLRVDQPDADIHRAFWLSASLDYLNAHEFEVDVTYTEGPMLDILKEHVNLSFME